ncbi:hypothetical protein [Helicobacter cynogastricus]|nr:hypothetical protein [Helicobacter cynogastricus]
MNEGYNVVLHILKQRLAKRPMFVRDCFGDTLGIQHSTDTLKVIKDAL